MKQPPPDQPQPSMDGTSECDATACPAPQSDFALDGLDANALAPGSDFGAETLEIDDLDEAAAFDLETEDLDELVTADSTDAQARATQPGEPEDEPFCVVERFEGILDAATAGLEGTPDTQAPNLDGGESETRVAQLRRSLLRAAPERERAIHLELASHLEGPLDDTTGALFHLCRAIEIDPSDCELLDRGMALAGLVGGELAQLDLLDQATLGAMETELRARLLARRATHMSDVLGWFEEAHEGWRMACELDPSCAEARERLE